MSVIVAELHLLEVEGEPLLGDPVVLDQPLFGVGPEALQAVDVDLARTEPPLMIDSQMAVAAEHQAVITAESVSIDDASPPDHPDRHAQEGPGRDIGHDLDFNHPLALENAEYRDFAGGSTSPVALAPSAEVGLVRLDLSPEEELTIRAFGGNAFSDQVVGLEDRRVRRSDLFGGLESGDLQLEELGDPEPVPGCDPELSNPPAGLIRELIPAVLAAIFLTPDFIDFPAVASGAKNAPPFPAGLGDVPPGPNFRFYKEFEIF